MYMRLTICALVAAGLVVYPAAGGDKDWDTTSGNWHTATNWDPAGVPTSGDNVWIGYHTANPVVTMIGGMCYADNLAMINGGQLYTQGERLWVADDLRLTRTSGSMVQLWITPSGSAYDVDCNTFRLQDGAYLEMQGGILSVDNVMTVDADSVVRGHGTITFGGPDTEVLDLSGDLLVSGGDLTIESTQDKEVDLDGASGENTIGISSGRTLRVDAYVGDAVGSTINIQPGAQMQWTRAWTSNGSIHLTSDSLNHAELSGTGLTVQGRLSASGSTCWVQTPITFAPSADVDVPAGGTLCLYQDTVYNGGSYSGGGVIQQDGDVSVVGDTSILTDVFDWDGVYNTTVMTVEAGCRLAIESDQIETSYPGDEGYDGRSNVYGTLAVNCDDRWDLDGEVHLYGGTLESTTIGGSTQGDVDIFGLLRGESGTSAVDAHVRVRTSADVSVATGATLRMGAPGKTVWYYGPTIAGGGMLVQAGDAKVYNFTEINTGIYDWDGDESAVTLVTYNARLTINADAIDTLPKAGDGKAPPTPTYDGTLILQGISDHPADAIVNTPGPWRVGSGGTIRFVGQLYHAGVGGQPVDNYGRVEGSGHFDSHLRNYGEVSPGLSVGVIGCMAGFRQYSSGETIIEIGGTNAGTTTDYLMITGLAQLAGHLELELLTGYEPDYADKVEILGSDTLTGHFRTVGGVLIGPDRALAVTYTPTDVWVTAALPGDANLDGTVDVGDLGILAANWSSSSGTWALAEFNGDGTVDVGDLGILASHYGQSVPWPAKAVPEPTALALLTGGSLGVLLRRRR